MRILVIGAGGTVGSAATTALTRDGHDVVGVSRSTTPSVDITDVDSIREMYRAVGTVDAIVSATGGAPFVATDEATPEQFAQGFANKLGGQVNLALLGLPHLSDGGSITLTTGILAQHPVRDSVVTTTVNAGVEGFVRAAATDLPRGIRINAISPTVLEEALEKFGPFFPGFKPAPGADVGQAFLRSVRGVETGTVIRVW